MPTFTRMQGMALRFEAGWLGVEEGLTALLLTSLWQSDELLAFFPVVKAEVGSLAAGAKALIFDVDAVPLLLIDGRPSRSSDRLSAACALDFSFTTASGFWATGNLSVSIFVISTFVKRGTGLEVFTQFEGDKQERDFWWLVSKAGAPPGLARVGEEKPGSKAGAPPGLARVGEEKAAKHGTTRCTDCTAAGAPIKPPGPLTATRTLPGCMACPLPCMQPPKFITPGGSLGGSARVDLFDDPMGLGLSICGPASGVSQSSANSGQVKGGVL